MKSEFLLDILETVIAGHLEYIPRILKNQKKDLVLSCLSLISNLRTKKI
jgi:hypothetical protein